MASVNDKNVLQCIFNPWDPYAEILEEKDTPDIHNGEEPSQEIKDLEMNGIRLTETGSVREGIDFFTKAIDKAPGFPSVYNNRAQALRLIGKDQDALEDLNKAIELCLNEGRTKRQALCQRGLIYRKQGQTEHAKRDFQAASLLGSSFAKKQLVELNPYAAMCNQMLQKVLTDTK